MTVLAVIGPTALYLMFSWLLSAIIASDLSDRKGYGEKPGLASGILLTVAGAIVWLFVPPRIGSLWHRHVHVVDLIMGVAAAVLLGALLAPWYSGGNFFDRVAWYELVVPFGAAVAYAQLHGRAGGRPPENLGTIALVAAAVALIGTLVAVITPPDGVSLGWGPWVALAAALVATGTAAAATRIDRSHAPGRAEALTASGARA